ncbi:MAG: hypothetical protein SF123_22095 [Chloroflexota bacterium]|nr:hypothetical protein [Chloroflexota bacterium]
MELKEIGQQLLNETGLTAEQWKLLVSEALSAILANQSVSELSSFLNMGAFDFPEEVTVSTLERMLHLGDLSKNTLWAYATQLDLYFVKQGLYEWLVAELKHLETSGGTDEEYRQIGEQVLRRLHDGNVDG